MSQAGKLAIAMITLLAGAHGAAAATSIRDQVSDAQLADFCSTAGLGETMASLTLADGTTLQGLIECEEEDLIVGDVNNGDDGQDVNDDSNGASDDLDDGDDSGDDGENDDAGGDSGDDGGGDSSDDSSDGSDD